MNKYKITYNFPEGAAENAYIIERSEAAAVRQLAKVCGNDVEVRGSELVEANVPATKELELEALEKIEAIVAELGPSSCVVSALDGVIDLARLNIENGTSHNFPDQLEDAEKRLREIGSKYNAARSDVEVLRSQLDHAGSELEAARAEIGKLNQKGEEYKETLRQMSKLVDEVRSAAGDAQRRAEEAETHVVQLKAKLYDYMIAAM